MSLISVKVTMTIRKDAFNKDFIETEVKKCLSTSGDQVMYNMKSNYRNQIEEKYYPLFDKKRLYLLAECSDCVFLTEV